MLCGEENPEQISRFASLHPRLLPSLGFRPPADSLLAQRRGVIAAPSNDTIARAMEMAQGSGLDRCLGTWLGRMSAQRQAASLDGKALRGQLATVLSLYSPALGHVLLQESVGTEENELAALLRILPELLSRLSKVRLFTGDAGFCHKEVARALAESRRDYLLQLKAPHLTDLRIAEEAFAQITQTPPLAETVEKKGGLAVPRS